MASFIDRFRPGQRRPTDVPAPADTAPHTPIEDFKNNAKEKKLRAGRLITEVGDGMLSLTVEARSTTSSDRSSVEVLRTPVADGEDLAQRLFVTEALIAQYLGTDPWIPMKDPSDPDRPFSGTDRDRLVSGLMASGVEPFPIPGVIEPQGPQQTG